MHSDIHEWIWFKLGMLIDTIEIYKLILVLLTLILGHRSARKQKFLRQLSLNKAFNQFLMEFSILFRLIDVMNCILIYLVYSVFKGENLTFMIC